MTEDLHQVHDSPGGMMKLIDAVFILLQDPNQEKNVTLMSAANPT